MLSKVCTSCNALLPLDAFSKVGRATGARPSRGGLGVSAICKVCQAEKRKPGITQERKKKADLIATLAACGLKACSVCRVEKSRDQFTKRSASPDGLSYKCRGCYAGYAIDWRAKNPGAFAEWAKQNEDVLRLKREKYRIENKERRAAYMSQWLKDNKGTVNARVARRMARKFQATPPWANDEEISALYARAAELTSITGIRHEVDHFYPLQGERVCGLHCEANLQILTKAENISKLNRMPEEWAGLLKREPQNHE